MSVVAQAAVLVTFPVTAAAVGSVVAVLRRPGPRVVSGIQHFAAGVVMAALVGEVLPELRQEGRLPWAVTGFVAGVAVVLSLGAYERHRDAPPQDAAIEEATVAAGTAAPGSSSPETMAPETPGPTAPRPMMRSATLPVGLLIAVGIDLALDGLLVGLGVTLGSTQGLILTIALTIEILFLGLSVATELTESGQPAARAALISSGLGLLTAVGAIGGAAVLGGASSPVLAAVLAFGAAALLYLAVEELLVEAHEETETPLLGAMFFFGFLTIYVLADLAA